MTIRASLALVLTLALMGCASRSAILSQTHATTVRLEMNDQGSCSGTAIGKHALLSATHCFAELVSLKVNGKPVTVLKRVDDGKDHTILVLDATFTSWSHIGGDPKQGDTVFVWGNPADFVDFYREGRVVGYISDVSGQMTTYSWEGFYGDSGSAIFDEDGRITAVTSFLVYRYYQGVGFKLMGSLPFAFTKQQLAEVA